MAVVTKTFKIGLSDTEMNNLVDKTSNQSISGAKTFTSPVTTDQIKNRTTGWQIVGFNGSNETQFGTVNANSTIFGSGNRPKYTKNGTTKKELALYEDLPDLTQYYTKTESDENVPKTQATVTVVQNALTNINGKQLTTYEATQGTVGIYTYYRITKSGNTVTYEEAVEYINRMSGTKFVPTYNYDYPRNSLWLMSNGTMWKLQYDSDSDSQYYGLYLFQIPIPYATQSWVQSQGYITQFRSDSYTLADGNPLVRKSGGAEQFGWTSLLCEFFGSATRPAYNNNELALYSDLSSKQDTLVSGTNIKTVGGQSVLGSGNIPFKTINNQSIVGSGNLTPVASGFIYKYIIWNGVSTYNLVVVGTANTIGELANEDLVGVEETYSNKQVINSYMATIDQYGREERYPIPRATFDYSNPYRLTITFLVGNTEVTWIWDEDSSVNQWSYETI